MTTNHYFPANPCDLRCLSGSVVPPGVSRFRYALRRAAITCTYGLAWFLGIVSTVCSRRISARMLQIWDRAYIRSTGLRIEISGNLTSSTPALVVANHMSSVDAMVLQRTRPFVVVTANDLAGNPILGRLLRHAGMIFVRQGSLASLRDLVASVTASLQHGMNVLAFPEGQIRCSPPGGRFSPAVLQAAIAAGVPVRPVLMWCELPDGRPTSHASWLGTEPLRRSLDRIQRADGLVLKVRVLPDIDPADGHNRTELARLARQTIGAATQHVPVACAAGRHSDPVEV